MQEPAATPVDTPTVASDPRRRARRLSLRATTVQMLAQWVMVLGFVVFAYLVVRRPFQSDPSVQNLAVLIDLLIATLSTGIAAASVRSGRSWVIFSAHLVVAGFLVRLIPSLILSLPPYQDQAGDQAHQEPGNDQMS